MHIAFTKHKPHYFWKLRVGAFWRGFIDALQGVSTAGRDGLSDARMDEEAVLLRVLTASERDAAQDGIKVLEDRIKTRKSRMKTLNRRADTLRGQDKKCRLDSEETPLVAAGITSAGYASAWATFMAGEIALAVVTVSRVLQLAGWHAWVFALALAAMTFAMHLIYDRYLKARDTVSNKLYLGLVGFMVVGAIAQSTYLRWAYLLNESVQERIDDRLVLVQSFFETHPLTTSGLLVTIGLVFTLAGAALLCAALDEAGAFRASFAGKRALKRTVRRTRKELRAARRSIGALEQEIPRLEAELRDNRERLTRYAELEAGVDDLVDARREQLQQAYAQGRRRGGSRDFIVTPRPSAFELPADAMNPYLGMRLEGPKNPALGPVSTNGHAVPATQAQAPERDPERPVFELVHEHLTDTLRRELRNGQLASFPPAEPPRP